MAGSTIQTSEMTTFIDILIAIVQQCRIERLKIKANFSLDIKPIAKALLRNQYLKTLLLVGPRDIESKETLQCFIEVLKTKHTTLQEVNVAKTLKKVPVCKRLEYYLRLNQSGRSIARDPSLPLE